MYLANSNKVLLAIFWLILVNTYTNTHGHNTRGGTAGMATMAVALFGMLWPLMALAIAHFATMFRFSFGL